MSNERISAAWGILALTPPFERARLPVSPDSAKRFPLLRICVHLLYFKTHAICLIKIKSLYADPAENFQPRIKTLLLEQNVLDNDDASETANKI